MTDQAKQILTPEEVKGILTNFDSPEDVLNDETDKEKVKRVVVKKDDVTYILTVVATGMYDHQSGDTHFAYGVHNLIVADKVADLDPTDGVPF